MRDLGLKFERIFCGVAEAILGQHAQVVVAVVVYWPAQEVRLCQTFGLAGVQGCNVTQPEMVVQSESLTYDLCPHYTFRARCCESFMQTKGNKSLVVICKGSKNDVNNNKISKWGTGQVKLRKDLDCFKEKKRQPGVNEYTLYIRKSYVPLWDKEFKQSEEMH